MHRGIAIGFYINVLFAAVLTKTTKANLQLSTCQLYVAIMEIINNWEINAFRILIEPYDITSHYETQVKFSSETKTRKQVHT